MTMTRHTVETADGERIAMRCYQADSRTTVVLLCPGFFKSAQTPTFDRLGRALAGTHDVVSMDFRGHGHSSGLYTFSAKEGADFDAVIGWAAARYATIGVVGFSMGAAIAINGVKRHPAVIRSLVLVSAPFEFEEIEMKFWTPQAIRSGWRGLEPGAGCRMGEPFLPKERPLDAVRRLDGLPKLFIHGTRDMIVDVRHAHRLYEAAPNPKRLAIIEGGSHAEALFRDAPSAFTALLSEWLQETLGGPAST